MELKFKTLSLKNFCGIKDFSFDFSKKTIICGANGLGKSTIRNAIFWVLYDKLANGNSATGIRPHDADGNDIDMIDIEVVLAVNIDGKDVELKKTQKQKWTKPRNETEKRFDGNVNEFEINGIPKKEKDYKDYIDTLIPLETLMYCTNAMAFLGLDSKKRREKLLALEKDLSNNDVFATNPAFADLESDLMDGTVDELLARSRKAIKEYNEELKAIPVRVDELEKSKVVVDVSELEIEKKALQAKVDKANNDVSDTTKRIEDIDSRLLHISFDKSAIASKYNDEYSHKMFALDNDLANLKIEKNKYLNVIEDAKNRITVLESELEGTKNRLNSAKSRYKQTMDLAFDDSSLTCPYCGQEYPDDKKEQIKADFEDNKKKQLEAITKDGESAKDQITNVKADITKYKKVIEDAETSIKSVDGKINHTQSVIMNTKKVDYENLDEYKVLTEEETKLKAEYDNLKNLANNSESCADLTQANARIEEINKTLGLFENNIKIDERISELRENQKSVSQKIADQEKKMDLLMEFNKARMQMLSDRVNKHFKYIKWQMFRPLIKGGYEDCCIPLINGTSYDGLLNNGNKILAEIDVCNAFQEVNDIICPIMADNMESLDSWRVPDLKGQIVVIQRTDDKVLTVKEG